MFSHGASNNPLNINVDDTGLPRGEVIPEEIQVHAQPWVEVLFFDIYVTCNVHLIYLPLSYPLHYPIPPSISSHHILSLPPASISSHYHVIQSHLSICGYFISIWFWLIMIIDGNIVYQGGESFLKIPFFSENFQKCRYFFFKKVPLLKCKFRRHFGEFNCYRLIGRVAMQ